MLSGCEAIIARTGGLVLSCGFFDGINAVVTYTSQLFPDMQTALKDMIKRYMGEIPPEVSILNAVLYDGETQLLSQLRGYTVFLIDE
jgi:hypothetical protein